MKTIVIVVLVIALTGALIFAVLPQFGIRTLPNKAVDFSEPEPETVEYVARPAIALGKQILSPWISEQSKDSAWGQARGKWVLWKGSIHSIEPAMNPNRIVLVYEYEAPLPYYTQRFGVVVEFDVQWSESLKQLNPGEMVYFRGKLVDKEFSLADIYRYGLDFNSHVLLLEQGQIIDENDIGAVLADLAYLSYEQIDSLLLAAERIDQVMNYFERRADVSSDLRWQLSSFATKLVNIQLPIDPSLSEDNYMEVQEMSLTIVRSQAALAKSEIEQTCAEALKLLHNMDTAAEIDAEVILDLAGTIDKIQTYCISEDEVEYLESIEDKDRGLGQPGIEDLFLALVTYPFGIWVEITAAVAKASATVIQDLLLHPVYEQMIVTCETYLGTINGWIKLIHEVSVNSMAEVIRII